MLVLPVAVAAQKASRTSIRRQLCRRGASMAQTCGRRLQLRPSHGRVDMAGIGGDHAPHGRSAAAMTVVLAIVPPTIKCTSACGQEKRARTMPRASAQKSSML